MKNVLIDSDILIDFLQNRKDFAKEAEIIFTAISRDKLKGFVTSVILSNAYYILNKTNESQLLRNALLELLDFLDVIPISKNNFIKALTSDIKDFEDSLQIYAAMEVKIIDIIITRNTKDYKKSSIQALTPSEFISLHLIT
jgi:predicted nucleic acid-binding protein